MESLAELYELLVDNETVVGRLVTSAVVVAAAVAVALVAGRLLARRTGEAYRRYYTRKITRYVVTAVTLLVLAVYWRPFAGRIAVVLGLASAGVAFAMQEVIGAVAGWFNILSGRIFAVGDRIQMGGVRGDVIDVTPLRTKIMEMGSPVEGESWVQGRQYTGRIVAVSNKATFTEPVYNYSATFEYIWEELSLPIPHDGDWRAAERIMAEEATRISSSAGAQEAIRAMTTRYPVPPAEVEPRVFVQTTDDWMLLSARFVVPVRTARSAKDDMTRRVRERLRRAGIRVASETIEATVHEAAPDRSPRGPGMS